MKENFAFNSNEPFIDQLEAALTKLGIDKSHEYPNVNSVMQPCEGTDNRIGILSRALADSKLATELVVAAGTKTKHIPLADCVPDVVAVVIAALRDLVRDAALERNLSVADLFKVSKPPRGKRKCSNVSMLLLLTVREPRPVSLGPLWDLTSMMTNTKVTITLI